MNRHNMMALMGATLAACASADQNGTFYGSPAGDDSVRFSEKSKLLFKQPVRELREFSVQGHTVMAYSKADAITRLKASGQLKNKKKKK